MQTGKLLLTSKPLKSNIFQIWQWISIRFAKNLVKLAATSPFVTFVSEMNFALKVQLFGKPCHHLLNVTVFGTFITLCKQKHTGILLILNPKTPDESGLSNF